MISGTQALAIARTRRSIGIDGLPVSGKSTLADLLERELDAVCLYLDDFVLPERLWPRPTTPAYPFPYIRHAEFIAAATELLTQRHCVIAPFDWSTGELGPTRTLSAENRPVVIEGVSALDPALAPHYDLRLWVESDRQTTLDAALERGGGAWAAHWRDYFVPSVDRYLETSPRSRADHMVAGRGV